MLKTIVNTDKFEKVFSSYDVSTKTAVLKHSDEFNEDSIIFVHDSEKGNWIFCRGFLYGGGDIEFASEQDVEQLVGLLPEMVTDIVNGTFDESCLEVFTGNSQYEPMTSEEVHEIIENVFNS